MKLTVEEISKKFVCETREYSSYTHHVAAPVFRMAIGVTGAVKNGEMLICGLGFYELFVNGEKITKGRLAPYISNTDHIIYYDKYDISSFLTEGENVIGIMLGDGFQNGKTKTWDFVDNIFNSAPKLALQIEVEDEKGIRQFDATDFRCKKGPVTFNDLRSGIFYDKRLEEAGWNAPGFCEDDSWHLPIVAETPRGKAKICEAEPVVVTREIKPVRVFRGEIADDFGASDETGRVMKTPEPKPDRTGGWIYDFGENNAGIFRLKIKGKKGQRIDLQCAEIEENGKISYRNMHFFPDGYAQRDIYIVGSEEEEIFEPMFTYHGYRYLYVNGITKEQATEELVTYLVMSSDLENRGSFSCSDAVANQIYEMGRRSDSSNFLYFPVDCPHREKNGWTGDAVLSAEHMILTMGVEKSWREWLNNIRCAQTETGMLPGIVPTGTWGYDWGNGPGWDSVLFTLPYMIYRYRGEVEAILETAHAMMSYLEYVARRRNERGLIEIGLGDWLPVNKYEPDVPLEFSDSVLTYDVCRMAAEMFEAVDLLYNRNFAKELGEALRERIRQEYVEWDTMTVKSYCQSAQAMGIYYGIFTEREKPEAFRSLLSIIHEKDDKMDSGCQGMRVIFHVLSENGESELAWDMITRSEFPSYGWYAERGYTTLPEHFVMDENGSRNHHFFGDVVQWFMRYPAGLQVVNSKKVKIKPSFIKQLNSATASHMLPDGEVRVSWKREDEQITLEVSYPKEVECEIDCAALFTHESCSFARVEKNVCVIKSHL